jgi:hypothetical protein
MPTTLFYYPSKEKPNPRKGATTFDGVNLEPGINVLEDDKFKKLQNHPDFKKYVDWGAISPTAEPLPLFLTTPSDPLEKTLNDANTVDLSTFIPTPPPKATKRKTAPVPSEAELLDEPRPGDNKTQSQP